MRIGVFGQGWWKAACEALGHDVVELPVAVPPNGNAYAADVNARSASGSKATELLARQRVDLLLDNGGAGLGFARRPNDEKDAKLAHEAAGAVLCSHFIDPLVAAFQGLPSATTWQALQSTSWVKCVWDRAQTLELRRFDVPNVVHLPMAAPDRIYNTEPIDPRRTKPIVSFVGGQNTTFFTSGSSVPTDRLFRGALAHAARGDLPSVTFYGVYHDLYGLGAPVRPDDDIETKITKMLAYFRAKVFYNASLSVRNRDRFVIFLHRHLGDRFHLAGRGWDSAYGLKTRAPFPTYDEYLAHFREAAINLNLVNGNAETGLNMRHFEITAAGGFLLCYDHPELSESFEVGKECVAFSDEADLLDKIEYYFDHPDERASIARAGQRRTLLQHLYSHRLRTLLGLLKEADALAADGEVALSRERRHHAVDDSPEFAAASSGSHR